MSASIDSPGQASAAAATPRGAGGPIAAPDPQIVALNKLRRDASAATNVSFVNGVPRAVDTSVRVGGKTSVARAKNFLDRYQELYGQFMPDPFRRTIGNPNELPSGSPSERLRDFHLQLSGYQGEPTSTPDLDLAVRGTSGPGNNVVAFAQTFKGIPIFGADLLVFVDGRRVKGSVGGLLSDVTLASVRPRLDADEAADAARRALGLGGPDTAPVLARSHLTVFDPSLTPSDGGRAGFVDSRPVLAWQIALGGPDTSQALVDATSGDLLVESPGAMDHDGLDDYDLDLEDANGVNAADTNCYWWTGQDDTLGDHDGLNSDGLADPEAVELWHLSRKTYKFFHGTYGRHSYDNDGGQIELYVHADVADVVARWTPGTHCDLIEFSDGAVAFDVLIHEFTHGVTQYSLLGKLIYQGQSGALNESHSDTMGARADGNWLVGEGTTVGAFRSLKNPPAFSSTLADVGTVSDPDRMSEFVTTTDDKGGVHVNSGIPNKAAFMIADGGTHPDTNVTVNGIGKAAMGWLTYMTINVIPPNSGFLDKRALMVAFAEVGGLPGWAVCSVRNAYFAVEIGNPDGNCDGTEDDPDPDGDGVLLPTDNCPGTPNPLQKDTDEDGNGDVCDGDADEDGVFWPDDNCPNLANEDQTDANFNGIGAACDPTEDEDFDDDGDLNDDDNCPLDPNEDQDDVDSDGDGDACDPDSDGDGWSNDDDNAPFEPNPGQQDSDGDGIGDVSDGCPNTKDESTAWTAGIPELGVDPTPLQPDSDDDGIPDACDPSVRVDGRTTAVKNILRADGDSRQVEVRGEPGAYLKVPISPTVELAGFPGSFADQFGQAARRRLELRGLNRFVRAGVIDDDGRTVGEASPKINARRSIRFRPLAGHRYYLSLYFADRFAGAPEDFTARLVPETVRVPFPEPPPVRRRPG